MTSNKALGALVLSLAALNAAGAQTVRIPVRQLPAPTGATTDTLLSVAAVRQLPNGNVLVNDQTRRRLSMFDKNMNFVSLVADSTSSTNNAYGVRPGGLLAYRGDSTLFIEPAGLSMLVIDPDGKIVRTMAAPRPNDVQFLLGGALGNPGFDSEGRLIYRTLSFNFGGQRIGGPGQPGAMMAPPTMPDTNPLVRFNLQTRKLDTVGFFKIPKVNMSMSTDANGTTRMSNMMNPLPVVDDWAVLSDGTVAFVRGQDYHVDFIGADGKVTQSEKIPYDWQRLTDDDKTRFLDSAKVAIETQRKAAAASAGTSGATRVVPIGGGDVLGGGMGGGGGVPQMVISMRGGGEPPQRGGDAPRIGGAAPGATGGPVNFEIPPVQMVPISDIPDYKPVFGLGSVRADMDGRLWVRTIATKPTPGGAIYDVIDRSGKLVDKIQVPANSAIAGFGAGGIVYLGVRDANGLKLQRVSVK